MIKHLIKHQSPDGRDDSPPGWWILLELLLVPLVAHSGGYHLVDDNPEPDWNKIKLNKVWGCLIRMSYLVERSGERDPV